MPVNSTIEVVIEHEKIAQVPDTLKSRTLFTERLPECFWSGFAYPFLVYPTKDDNQIFYTGVSSLGLNSTVSSDLLDVGELSSTNWEKSDQPCDEVGVGCFYGDLSIYMDPTPPKAITDDCGCIMEIQIPRYVDGILEFTLDYGGVELSTTVSSEFRAEEDPFPTTLAGSEYSLLPKMSFFDVEDYYGNGVLFGNKNSSSAFLLNRIFDDIFTNKIQESISNFGVNHNDLDTSTIGALNVIGESLGFGDSGFKLDTPVEMEELITIGSIRWIDLFGFDDVYSKYNSSNLGNSLNMGDIITHEEYLLYEDLVDGGSNIGVIVVPQKFNPIQLSYPLSSLELDHLENLELYRFWRIDDERDSIISARLSTNLLSGIPDEEFWEVLVRRKIEKKLLDESFS